MAATNKSLAQSNKSHTGVPATNSSQIPHRVDPYEASRDCPIGWLALRCARVSSGRWIKMITALKQCHGLKMALIGAAIIVLAEGSMAATITVHEPDGQGRVFVDVVGQINDEDFKTFKEKTDQIYPIGAGHPQ
jgi:hypothetical protein